MKKYLSGILVLLLLASLQAGEKDPISGEEFNNFIASQYALLQHELEQIFSEAEGYLITGPMDTRIKVNKNIDRLYHTIRIICPEVTMLPTAYKKLKDNLLFKIKNKKLYLEKAKSKNPAGYRGALIDIEWNKEKITIQLNSVQQTRWLIWAKRAFFAEETNVEIKFQRKYLHAVSDYLYAVDNGDLDYTEPQATDFNLLEEYDFYAPRPDYIISGYQNYLDFLYSHSEIKTNFANSILAFIPTDSLLETIIINSPEKAYPNKEAPMLQYEYRKFFNRGGDIKIIQTLTKTGFDTLKNGEYFYAVGLNGKIRFGRELSREEVSRIEKETGKKVARANHAFLFPGEPVLTAGAFFIEEGANNNSRLVKVNAHSGHYFYSNVSATVKEDISENSNYYLFTLGHFFKVMNELEIPYNNIIISKF